MAEMPDVVTGEVVASDWGNDIRDRTVQRYASAAARSASIPSPVEGDLSYLNDTNQVYVWTGAAWTQLTPTTITDYEIDGYTEATSATPNTVAFSTMISVTLTIPATWASWKCYASASWYADGSPNPNTPSYAARLMFDGSPNQTLSVPILSTDGAVAARVGRRTGITTTGARTIVLQAQAGTSTIIALTDLTLYARAVRLT